MIYVIATVECNQGRRGAYLDVLRSNIPNVRAEQGCLKYEATLDVNSGIPVQGPLRENVVTIVEAWGNLDALHRHLKAPHMLAYREKAKDLVSKLSIQVLESV